MNVVEIRAALISHGLSLGMFQSVSGHEPKAAPPNGLTGALWLANFAPARGRSGLDATTMRLEFSFRIGQNMLAEPQDDLDAAVLVATASLMNAYSNDFELGGYVAQVDLLGAYGTPLSGTAGYLEQDKRLYRVMVLTIPLIVNDVFDQSP